MCMAQADPVASTAIRATIRGFWRIKPLASTVCELSYVVQVALGGSIPKELLALRKKQTLSVVLKIQDKYERNGKLVDAEMRAAFPSPPCIAQLDSSQRLIVERCRVLEGEEGGEWEPLLSPNPFVTMHIKHAPPAKGERQIAVGKATATIDCSAHEAMSWWYAFMSRKNWNTSLEGGDPALLVAKQATRHDIVVATIKKLPFPLHNREFVNRCVCVQADTLRDTLGDFFITSVPVDGGIDYGMNPRSVRGVSISILQFTSSSDSQCTVSYTQKLDAGGQIPTWLVNLKIPEALSGCVNLRDEFQRDYEIDRVERDQLARVISDEPQTLTPEEEALVNKIQVKLGMLKDSNFDSLESPDHLVNMKKLFVDGSSSGVGRASAIIDASVFDCAAWEMSQMMRERVRNHGSLERSLTKINDHHAVFHAAYDFAIPGFMPREFLQSLVWRLQGDQLTAVYDSVDRADFAPSPLYVRGTSMSHILYEKLQVRTRERRASELLTMIARR